MRRAGGRGGTSSWVSAWNRRWVSVSNAVVNTEPANPSKWNVPVMVPSGPLR